VRTQVEKENYWFHKIELWPGLVTPGRSDPLREKLPFFGLPEEMQGLRVLDVGCAEGFFSFEAERRGAREVIAIDSFPDSVRRFNICRAAFNSKATAF
jgi:tRNA (mo5U34)-methyltransferase